jgi:hypothetical protein
MIVKVGKVVGSTVRKLRALKTVKILQIEVFKEYFISTELYFSGSVKASGN